MIGDTLLNMSQGQAVGCAERVHSGVLAVGKGFIKGEGETTAFALEVD
jgi:hypothetical protein